MTEHDVLFHRLKPELGQETIETLKLLHSIGSLERKQRIEKILTLSAKKILNDSLLNDFPLLPPSSKEDCEGELLIGDICYGQNNRIVHPLYLKEEDIKNHVIVTGLSGSGKTTFAYNLFVKLAQRDKRCLVFDWDRTWRNLLSLNEPFAKKIKVYTIGRNDICPFAWNLFFSPPPNTSFSSWLGIASSKPLQKSLLSGQGVEDYLENLSEELWSDFQTGILKLLPNLEDIKNKIKHKFARARQLLWKQSAERVLKDMTRDSIKEVFSSRNPLDIAKDILEYKGAIIIEMDIETPQHLRVLFQEIFLTYMLLYHLHKGETPKEHLETAIFLEEFPNMLPKSKIELETGSDIIKNLFKEGRKFGLGLIAIAQESSELPNYVMANCKVQAHFACQTKRDIEATASALFLQPYEIRYLDYIWQGECIMKVKGRAKNCLVKIPAPPILKKISDEELIQCQRRN